MDSSVLLGSNKDIKFYTLGECVTYHIITYVCSPLQTTAVIFLYETPVHHNDGVRFFAFIWECKKCVDYVY